MTKAESFIEFRAIGLSDSGKTTIWEVVPNGSGQKWVANLGLIKWFGRWRCYAFFPRTETVFERKCLRDIADFCEARTMEHRKDGAR